MEKLRGNLIFGQSGGPTSVFNASAAGVFTAGLEEACIPHVFGAAHGIAGLLKEEIYDMGAEDKEELLLLKTTPSSALGSCRYKMKDYLEDDREYRKLLEILKKYDIRYFFYNGGNDSMDTCNKISRFLRSANYECRVVGIPKTIDNDLCGTDHCPGFASAAKYVATTTMEIYEDARVYDQGMICVVEVMGRHAGWLTAATALAKAKGSGPDLIYLPEIEFDLSRFLADVKEVYMQKSRVLIAVSEGVRTKEGSYIPELIRQVSKDSFGHKQLGGSAQVLADFLRDEIGCKVRGIELSLMQRAASHLASAVDVEEAFGAGRHAVEAAVRGESDVMIGIQRLASKPYRSTFITVPLAESANHEKLLDRSWINAEGNGVTEAYLDYAFPLIDQKSEPPCEDGLPRYARLKKRKAKF